MQVMVLRAPGSPLELREVPMPALRADQVLLRVECCAVCRTDLHVVDGELRNPKLPLIPGHQIFGIDESAGTRLGVAPLRIETRRTVYPLAQANEALAELRSGKLTGTAVLTVR